MDEHDDDDMLCFCEAKNNRQFWVHSEKELRILNYFTILVKIFIQIGPVCHVSLVGIPRRVFLLIPVCPAEKVAPRNRWTTDEAVA